MCERSARCHYYSIEAVLLDNTGNLDLCILGAGIEIIFHMHHVREGAGIFPHRRDVHNAADVNATVTDKDPDARVILTDSALRGRFFGFGPGPAGLAQGGAAGRSRSRGLHDGLRNILGALKRPTDIDPRSAGGHWQKGVSFGKVMLIQFDTQSPGQVFD